MEKLRALNYRPPSADAPEVRPPGAEEAAQDITRDAKTFTAAIRTKVFTFLRALANGDFEQALAPLHSCRGDEAPSSSSSQHPAASSMESRSLLTLAAAIATDAKGQPWTADRLRAALDSPFVEHRFLLLDPGARNARHTCVTPSEGKKSWHVRQVLVDPDEHNDWCAGFDMDLAETRAKKEPMLRLRRIGAVG